MSEQIKHQIQKLVKLINKWNQEYYILNKPSVSDFEYDDAINTLIKLENDYPQYKQLNSPTLKVGSSFQSNSNFKKMKHAFPMLSLSNVFDDLQLNQFFNKSSPNTEFIIEPKIDGVSISLIYKNGVLTHALTRGDGEIGEDVIENIKQIKAIPKQIPFYDDFEVRGELFLNFETFEKINSNLETSKKYANPRNLTAGTIRNLDPQITKQRNLMCFLYHIPSPTTLDLLNVSTQSQVLEKLRNFGFQTAHTNTAIGLKQAYSFAKQLENNKNNLTYPIDGAVIKINNLFISKSLGSTAKAPKGQIAFKFKAQSANTKLIDIKTTVGKTGKITYVASLQPVSLAGSIIQNATLHNSDYIISRDLRIGDNVEIIKAAEIIPAVLKYTTPQSLHNTLNVFKPIEKCPVCETVLAKKDGLVDQFCPNLKCPAQQLAKLEYFASKNAMDLTNLSSKTIRKLYELNIIRTWSDFYNLKDYKTQIISNHSLAIKEVMFNKIVSNIEKSKNTTLNKFLTAINIPNVGPTTAKMLSKKLQTLDNFLNTTKEDLISISGIDSKTANGIVNFISNKEIKTAIIDVSKHLTFANQKNNFDINSPYFEKSICITGSFSIPRSEIMQKLQEMYNVHFVSSISKNTDFLLLGENGGSKYKKATQLNIPIIQDKIWISTKNYHKNKK